MITKQDCYLLLVDLSDRGVDTSNMIRSLSKQANPSVDVIKFINDNRELELSKFYSKLKKSYNNKKSKLYINIVKSDEIDQSADVIISTLSSLLLQITLFAKDLEISSKKMFLSHARFNEICRVLSKYYDTFSTIDCQKLLRIIKADLKVLEELQNE